MSTGTTLLERLLGGGRLTRGASGDRAAIMRSVMGNLRDLLAARRGSSLAQPDLGLPAPNELRHNYPETIADHQRSIATTIATYEPRLRDVEVTYVQVEDEQLTLHFQVAATLATEGLKESITFETCVDHSGKTKVEG
jgi:type VI secretion system protein